MIWLGLAQQAAADAFLTAGTLEKEYKKKREAAKEALVKALGKHAEGTLPDGRRVSKTIAHFEEATFTRSAYDSTTISVSALSSATVRDELEKLSPENSLPCDRGKCEPKGKRSAPLKGGRAVK